jgi:hypothetical protein
MCSWRLAYPNWKSRFTIEKASARSPYFQGGAEPATRAFSAGISRNGNPLLVPVLSTVGSIRALHSTVVSPAPAPPLFRVGHARQWDRIGIDGRLEAKDCTVTYRHSGRKLAVLTIGRDRDSLAGEIELEKAIAAAGWSPSHSRERS